MERSWHFRRTWSDHGTWPEERCFSAAKAVVEPKAVSSTTRSVTLLSPWFGNGPCLVEARPFSGRGFRNTKFRRSLDFIRKRFVSFQLRKSNRKDGMAEAVPDRGTSGSAASERMNRVLDLLDTREVVSVTELAHTFAVSEVTVRSDLAILARQGLVARIRGGARALQRGQSEVAFDVRLRVQQQEKRAIARAAAAMVGDGEAVALDSSTTAFYIALELREKKELVVVTNGLRVASALADAAGVSVIVPGGVLRLAAMSLVGDFASSVLRTTSIGKGFFGARGVGLDRGLMDLNPEEVRIKREMAEVCECVIGVFDHTKWRRSALLSFVPTQRVSAIVTDARAPHDLVDEWRAHDVEVVLAEPEANPGLRNPSQLSDHRRPTRSASEPKEVADTIS